MAIHAQRKQIVVTGFVKNKVGERKKEYVEVKTNHVKMEGVVKMKQNVVQKPVLEDHEDVFLMTKIAFLKIKIVEAVARIDKNAANLMSVMTRAELVNQENALVRNVNVNQMLLKIMRNVVKA